MKKTIQKLKKNVFTQFSLKIFEYICRKLASYRPHRTLYWKHGKQIYLSFFFYRVTFLQFAIQAAIIKKMWIGLGLLN